MKTATLLLTTAALASAAALAQPPAPSTWTTLPQVFLDTTYAPGSGRTIAVNAGANLQAALDGAALGDTIVLQAGATFTGPITLRNKTAGTGWIYIRSSAYASLPKPGNRVAPSDAAHMPKIVGSGKDAVAIRTASGAHHYRFVGIEIAPAAGAWTYGIVQLGGGETNAANLPHDIVFDRCYIHGDPVKGGRRAIALNSASTAVIDSYLSDWKEAGADSQAIAGWNTPGPVKIANNFLQGAAENVMFGGADPSIANLVPSDIEIRGNHFHKPVAWRTASPAWTVKNLLELKNAQRVLIEGNVFENTWAAAQEIAVLVAAINQGGKAPWTTTGDITFRLNIVRGAPNGIGICGLSCAGSGVPNTVGSRYLVQDNLFEDIDVTRWGGSGGKFAGLGNQARQVVIDRNTAHNSGSFFGCGDEPTMGKLPGFRFTNNIVNRGPYGFICSGRAPGASSFNSYFPDGVMTGNVIVGPMPDSAYPPGNHFVATRPAPGKYPNAGADMAALGEATRCTVSGKCVP